MKTTLKKILLISLLFSATVPSSTVQANSLNWAALRSKGMVSWLCTNGGNFCSFLSKNPIAVLGTVVGTALVWKMRKIILDDNLWSAINSNNIVEVKQALANGADVNKGEFFGGDCNFTPLMFAAGGGCLKRGNSKIVELLLATNKVDINQQDDDGQTALMFAAECEKISRDLEEKQKFRNIIGQLLAAGADPLLKAKVFWLSKNDGSFWLTRTDGTTVLEQGSNETKEIIKKFMAQKREQTLGPLKEAVAALPGSLELPDELATFISECTY